MDPDGSKRRIAWSERWAQYAAPSPIVREGEFNRERKDRRVSRKCKTEKVLKMSATASANENMEGRDDGTLC